ncbi:MAG TPA: hypothetical protein VKQ36_08165 [Ktedonobacterales bacterium]|nr:hypothetical protein [Ktedonobacterales bacterium]
MRVTSYVLIALGVIILVAALIDHQVAFLGNLNGIGHINTYIAGAGVLIAIIGGALLFLAGGKSSTEA